MTGNLTVKGTTTLIETTDLAITDNIIILNKNDTVVGYSPGTSGIEIERGTLVNHQMLFVEANDYWTVGESGCVLGTSVHRLSELGDATQTQGDIPGYDANGCLSETEGLTTGEVNQIPNIDSVTITNTQWGYLGSTDQDLSTTSNVTFNDLTVNGDLSLSAENVLQNSVANNATNSGKCYTIVLKTYRGVGKELTVATETGDFVEGN